MICSQTSTLGRTDRWGRSLSCLSQLKHIYIIDPSHKCGHSQRLTCEPAGSGSMSWKESSYSWEILLCKPRGLSQRGSLESQQCSIHHDFVVTLYTPGACVWWSESGHNAGKLVVVLGTRYGTLWPWCGQLEVELLQLLQLLSGVGISWEVLVLVSQDTDLYHV